jgi:hypothetical protein
MDRDCLDRPTLKALAEGRCPKSELARVRRHLPNCARCRAAVVAAAAGVRGPGDTVLLTRAGSGGPARTGLKVASVAVSLVVAGAAWRFGVSAPSVSAPSFSATSPALAPASPALAPASPAPPIPAAPEASPAAAPSPEPAAPPEPPSSTVQIQAPLEPAAAPSRFGVRPIYEPVVSVDAAPPAEPAAPPSASRPLSKKPRRPVRPLEPSGRPSADQFGIEY